MTTEPIEVRVTGIWPCDLCSDHYSWECPRCELGLEHFPEVRFPLDVECQCGAVSRISKAESDRWRREALGERDDEEDEP